MAIAGFPVCAYAFQVFEPTSLLVLLEMFTGGRENWNDDVVRKLLDDHD